MPTYLTKERQEPTIFCHHLAPDGHRWSRAYCPACTRHRHCYRRERSLPSRSLDDSISLRTPVDYLLPHERATFDSDFAEALALRQHLPELKNERTCSEDPLKNELVGMLEGAERKGEEVEGNSKGKEVRCASERVEGEDEAMIAQMKEQLKIRDEFIEKLLRERK